jgi:putative acetyltransferase
MNASDPDQFTQLRETWQSVTPADYEAHMSRIGQAEANANHVADWMRLHPEARRIVFAGAGTGQMFDFLRGHEFLERDITFTDINQAFLTKLEGRLTGEVAFDWKVVQDDLLASNLGAGFDAAILVLVLEHVDWQRAVEAFARWGCQHALIVIQENPTGLATAVSPAAPLGLTMQPFRDSTRPHLIPLGDLRAAMQQQGYGLARVQSAFVLDGKMMHGCYFSKGLPTITQHSFRPDLAPYFESLNLEWIEANFIVEDRDRAYFSAPYERILVPGGQIYFAESGGQYVGTASYIPLQGKRAELGKLGVTAHARGQGIGKLLIDWVVAHARQAGCEELVLYSDSKLQAALRLYERYGFEHIPFENRGYARGDIAMLMRL